MAATKLPELAVPDFKEHLPRDLLPATADGLLKAIENQQLPVRDLQASLFPTTSSAVRTWDDTDFVLGKHQPIGAVVCSDRIPDIQSSRGTYLSSFLQNTLKSNQLEINAENKSLRPIAKLKEPRDLFALPKELDCPLQPARWPTECQVFEERVQHIEYTPCEPEPYYQPTGREVQPKPVGEEAGSVIFQYYPMSAVNYFSRSSVGGSRYFLQAIPADREGEDELRFESRFESGNLAKVVKVTETYYELYLRTDLYTNRHMQWYYFKVSNTKPNINYRFSIVNLSKGDSLYGMGMKPLMYSTKDAKINSVGWRRFGENIAYYRNDPANGEDDQSANYTLTFNLEFLYEKDEVYIAHCYPYTYTDLQDYLNKLQNHPIKSTFTKLRLLCRTLAGNNVYYLTITAPSIGEEPKRKKAVVITARVHPGETPSSWMMKGFIDFLTGESEQAKELREKFIFKLVPMLNPDGVIVGNNRCSLTGRDLNRQYRTVIRETYPPVWHTKLMIRRLMEECGIVMYCDLHAHSRKHNVFIYGCENKRYVEKRLQEQVFPLMLHKNAADKFSFENCKFRIQRSKEGTGRVVVWMMGVANSYTMEASFAGTTMGSRLDTHFTVQDFETMGRSFCETLLDFCDEDPSKEKLRTKIIERLVKEGSSADEPTNINLSDYSSDEGDTSSSSEDFGMRKESIPPWTEGENEGESLTVPPPSPEKKKKDGSPKKKATVVQERSPPPPRRPLQVHKTTIDPPVPQTDGESSGGESGDDSTSWSRGGGQRRPEGQARRGRTKRMPPELIVTQAKQSSPEMKQRVARQRGRSLSCHHSRSAFQPREGTDTAAVNSNELGGSLRRKIWTGCPCNAVHSDTALSKDSTLKKGHWSKGPISWSTSSAVAASEALLRSCSQKLIALQKITKPQTEREEGEKSKLKKRKSWPKKKLIRNSKTDDEQVIITDWTELVQKNGKKITTGRKSDAGLVETASKMTFLRGTDPRRGSKQGDTEKIAQNKSQRSKFRTGGLVATAVANCATGSADTESESEVQEKNTKKKKKRKTRLMKKLKRPQSEKVTPPNKTK